MRLNRYRGDFPKKCGPSGRILEMQITPELNDYLVQLNR
jgi:hypothetical protein